MMRIAVMSLTIAFCFSIGIVGAQNVSDEAMRHFDRGQAAVEMAKTPADYEDAVKEFEKAAKLAPEWPDVYYNLGLIQDKLEKYEDAVKNLKKYIELFPNAGDSRDVKKHITKLEYKMEIIKEAKLEEDPIKVVIGVWAETQEYLDLHTRDRFLEVRFVNGQFIVSAAAEHLKNEYTSQDLAQAMAEKERWVPAEFDGEILTFHYGSSITGPNNLCEYSYTIEFPPYGTPEGHFIKRYTNPGYTGCFGSRRQKVSVKLRRAWETEINTWNKLGMPE